MGLSPARARGALLWRFLLLTWLAVLVNLAGLLARAPWSDALVGGYTLAVYLTYALFYLAPVFLPLWLLHLLLSVPAALTSTTVTITEPPADVSAVNVTLLLLPLVTPAVPPALVMVPPVMLQR